MRGDYIPKIAKITDSGPIPMCPCINQGENWRAISATRRAQQSVAARLTSCIKLLFTYTCLLLFSFTFRCLAMPLYERRAKLLFQNVRPLNMCEYWH